MGRPSKLSEEAWEALFDLDRAGVRRAVLAERFGISVSTITWQARKRGRMKTQDPLAVDHRRRPAGGWGADHVFCQSRSGMTPGRWRDLLRRRNRGEADAVLAAEYGVHPATIASAARRYGLRKCDVVAAVIRPRGPGWGGEVGRPEMAFSIDADDPEVHRRSILVAIKRAAEEERIADLRLLLRVWSGLEVLMGGPPPGRARA